MYLRLPFPHLHCKTTLSNSPLNPSFLVLLWIGFKKKNRVFLIGRTVPKCTVKDVLIACMKNMFTYDWLRILKKESNSCQKSPPKKLPFGLGKISISNHFCIMCVDVHLSHDQPAPHIHTCLMVSQPYTFNIHLYNDSSYLLDLTIIGLSRIPPRNQP